MSRSYVFGREVALISFLALMMCFLIVVNTQAANPLRRSALDRTYWKGAILPLLFFKRIRERQN